MGKKKFTDSFADAPDPDQMVFGMPASTYTLNGDMTRVGEELIGRFESLGHLRNFQIVFLRRESTRTDNEFHVDAASGVFIRSDRERAIRPDIDGGVWLQGRAWDRFDVSQRRAWLHGLLLRLGMTAKGSLRKMRPDVSEWAEIAREYGPWQDQLKLFAEATDSHVAGSKKPAALRAVPTEGPAAPLAN